MDTTYMHSGGNADLYRDKSDEVLADLVITDPYALVVLIQRYESKLMSYIRRISGFTKEDAEEVLQDSFLDAYKHIADFDPDLKFSSWIYRIVHNRTISAYRKKHRSLSDVSLDDRDLGLNKILISGQDNERAAENSLTSDKVRLVLDRLPDRDRSVLVLAYLEEKTYEEISDILEAPMGTVATWISRAKTKFQKTALEHQIIINL